MVGFTVKPIEKEIKITHFFELPIGKFACHADNKDPNVIYYRLDQDHLVYLSMYAKLPISIIPLSFLEFTPCKFIEDVELSYSV